MPRVLVRLPSRWLGAGLASALGVGLALRVAPTLVALFVPLMFALVVLKVLVEVVCGWDDEAATARVERWTLAVFFGHLLLGLVITSSFRLTTYLGGDALQYHFFADSLLRHWSDGSPLPDGSLPPGKSGFIYMLASLYWVFGSHQVAGLVVNALFAAAIVPIMTDATRRYSGPAAARYVPALVSLPLGFLLWPSELLREAGVLFFIAVAVNASVRLQYRTRLASVLMAVSSLGLLLTFRHYMAFTVAGGMVLGLVLGRRGVGGLQAGASAAVLLIGLLFGLGFGYSGYRAVRSTSFQQVNYIRLDSSRSAASGFLGEADVASGTRAIRYLPSAIPRVLFGPFPWEIRGGRQLLAIPDALVWWLLLPALGRGAVTAWRRQGRGVWLIIVTALTVTGVIALLVANYGTVVRSRMQVMLIVVPFIALGLSERRTRTDARGRASRGGSVRSVKSMRVER